MKREYLIDGEIIAWEEMIKKACEYDSDFAESFIKTTSRAASILRENGYSVECRPAAA